MESIKKIAEEFFRKKGWGNPTKAAIEHFSEGYIFCKNANKAQKKNMATSNKVAKKSSVSADKYIKQNGIDDVFIFNNNNEAFDLRDLLNEFLRLNQKNENLLSEFFNSKSDANTYLDASQQEDLEKKFAAFVSLKKLKDEQK